MPRSLDITVGSMALALVLALVAGCASKRPAPVAERAAPEPLVLRASEPKPAPENPSEPPIKIHVVQKGDTLISLALQYGLDYRELAAWNNIENVNVIRVGQELRVSAPGIAPSPVPSPVGADGTVVTPLITAPSPGPGDTQSLANTATLKVEPRAIKVPYSDKAFAQMEAEARAASTAAAVPAESVASTPAAPAAVTKGDDESVDWAWPAKGKVLAGYTEASKGIDIAGSLGAVVLAAAGGKVVYSGTGLRGYGKLIIIKHNNTYLSAYAHNNNIFVKEGQDVKKGQRIAEMGSTDTDKVKLHFEIRKQGKPVDPSRLLPAG
jgi:lipoprotein NlpD